MVPVARRLSPEVRQAQILDAAIELFAAHPEDDVRLVDVADAAGVTRNLLFHYFAGKAALHRAAVERALGDLAARHDLDESRALDEKVPANIGRWLDAVEHGDPAFVMVLKAAHSAEPAVAEVAGFARELLARGIAYNHLGETDPPPAVVAALLGYIALGERLNHAWLVERTLTRADVERILTAGLGPIIEAASA